MSLIALIDIFKLADINALQRTTKASSWHHAWCNCIAIVV